MSTTILNPELAAQSNNPAAPAAESRPMYVHSIPKGLVSIADGITKIGIVKLLPGEQMLAVDRTAAVNGSAVALHQELAKESLRLIERGSSKMVVSTFNGTAEREWAKMDPIMRDLIVRAYTKHHVAKDEEAVGFLESCEIQV
jgi:hypothetical protein